jgi:hypothetical protein
MITYSLFLPVLTRDPDAIRRALYAHSSVVKEVEVSANHAALIVRVDAATNDAEVGPVRSRAQFLAEYQRGRLLSFLGTAVIEPQETEETAYALLVDLVGALV